MNLTIAELKEKLMQFDELDLIELLDLTSEDILDRFEDVVEDKYELLKKEI
jgi:hypothetical protein|tara:strand:- start:627 stop:779 length:153 start_codon:yes stop_codon:yes gene_type:complete